MTWDTMSIIYMLIGLVVNIVVNSLFVWLAGKALVGGEKAKFTDAIWIVVLGSVLNVVVGFFLSDIVGLMLGPIIGAVISFILWLGLIKHFFDCGWVKAFLIAVLAVIIQFVVSFLIGILLGVAIFTLGI